MFLFFRVFGKILKVYVQDFEIFFKDGYLYVIVQNIGYVIVDFFVS